MRGRFAMQLGLAFLISALSVVGCKGACKGDSQAGSVDPRPVMQPQSEQKAQNVPAKADVDSAAAHGPRFAPLPTGPLSKEDTADCEVEKELMDKVTCLGALAQRRRDPRFCDRIASLAKTAGEKAPALIRSGNAASACHRTIAFVRDDPKLCVAIQQDSMAAGCLSYFAMKRHDPKVCDLATGEAAASCYLNEAARTHDASLCAKTGHFAEDCNKRLGPQAVKQE